MSSDIPASEDEDEDAVIVEEEEDSSDVDGMGEPFSDEDPFSDEQ